jgi:hypothetical protein
MLWLPLVIVVLLSGFHAVMEPLLNLATPLFELRGWIWIPLVLAAWLLAGQRG